MKLFARLTSRLLITAITILFVNFSAAYAANVSLRWDANVPDPEGYRVFVREEGQSHNYSYPIWENNLTTCTLTGLVEGVTYYFVVRAFDGELESVDSEEVSYTPALVATDPEPVAETDPVNETEPVPDATTDTITDTDGDNVSDALDIFPNDPNEWADNDGDGIGDNQDTDDDNDGMPDAWEMTYGLDPREDDSQQDADGDGVSNLDEFVANSDPIASVGNLPPDAPIIDTVLQTERVGLTPVLVCGAYFDADNNDHYKSQWQISTDSDFGILILDETSMKQLTAYTVGEMVLDVDTVYYWRVRFMDVQNATSDWSETGTFTTIAADSSIDMNIDGIPDAQAVDETVDVNENGIPDVLEDTIMCVNSVEGQTVIGVETTSDNVTLVSIKSLPTDGISDKSVKLGFGLVGFKLYLSDGVKTATVRIHFSKQVPRDAMLYKYTTDNGWEKYENASFAANRKSVTLVLEDGGIGDEDGVENGVIVDPTGIAYESVDTPPSGSDSAAVSTGDVVAGGTGSDAGCFISAAGTARLSERYDGLNAPVVEMIMTLLGLGILVSLTIKEK